MTTIAGIDRGEDPSMTTSTRRPMPSNARTTLTELRNARIEQAIRQLPDASATRIAGLAECSPTAVVNWRKARAALARSEAAD
ncbi:MAG TPA: hypothetical protein VGC82_02560 [Rhodopila sp.]